MCNFCIKIKNCFPCATCMLLISSPLIFFRFKSSLIFPLMILGVIALHNSCKMFWKLAKRKLEVINYKNTLLQRK